MRLSHFLTWSSQNRAKYHVLNCHVFWHGLAFTVQKIVTNKETMSLSRFFIRFSHVLNTVTKLSQFGNRAKYCNNFVTKIYFMPISMTNLE